MFPDRKQYEDMVLTLYHSMARLRSNINEVLEIEIKKVKEQLLTHDEKE
mgnify:FL=1